MKVKKNTTTIGKQNTSNAASYINSGNNKTFYYFLKEKLEHGSDSGFTLIEMLVSAFIMVIILVLTLTVFVTYNQSFNNTLSLQKVQLQAEQAMNSLAAMIRSQEPCPGGSQTFANDVVYTPATNTLEFPTPFPNRSYTSTTGGSPTNIAEVTIVLSTTTDILTGTVTPCANYNGNSYNPISATNVSGLGVSFVNTATVGGVQKWDSANPPTLSSSYGSSTVGIQLTLDLSSMGQQIALINSGYFVNVFCSSSTGGAVSVPSGGGGCVI